MLKKIFGALFNPQKNKEEKAPGNYIVATIHEKIMPIDRGEIYEDPLDDFLKSKGYGEVTGGGTMQCETGEIEYCDIEIKLFYDTISRDGFIWMELIYLQMFTWSVILILYWRN